MGHERLLPAKRLYPPSMMRPEEISKIVTFSSEQKVTYTQVLTNQWEELEHCLYDSETSKITIAKIETTSRDIRKSANLPTPRPDPKPQPARSTQVKETSYPGSKNHNISSQKRDRDPELAPESVTSYLSKTRARTDKVQVNEKTFERIENISEYYSHLLVIWSRPMTPQQKQFLDETMKGMLKLKSAVDFDKPPTAEQKSCWPKKIKGPMDLFTLIKLLETNKYRTVTDFCADFKIMIVNAHLIYGENHDVSAAARRLLTSFRDRMRSCPTGVDGTEAKEYDKGTMKLLDSLIPNVAANKTSQPYSDRLEVINIDSDEDEGKAAKRPAVASETRKTPEPDDLEDETAKLHKEIEERQQKLANMAEKKKLLAEIRTLDSEVIELESKRHGMQDQHASLGTMLHKCSEELKAHDASRPTLFKNLAWYQKEIERLDRDNASFRRQIERNLLRKQAHRQKEERLALEAGNFSEKQQRLTYEQDQSRVRKDQAMKNIIELEQRIEGLEDQRTITKKKLDALDDVNA